MKGIKMPTITPSHRFIKWIIIPLACIVVLLFIGSVVLSRYATKQVEERLRSTGSTFESLSVNLFFRRVTISSLELNPSLDSGNSTAYKGRIKNIVLKDIRLYQLVKNKKLHIGELLLTEGSIEVNLKTKKKDAEAGKKEIKLEQITIDRLRLVNFNAVMFNDTLIQYAAKINSLTIAGIHSSDTADITEIKAYSVKNVDAKISDLLFNSPNGFYRTQAARIEVRSSDQKLILDSIVLQPQYPKYKFARKTGRQIDRVNAFIRRIEISDLNFRTLSDSIFSASKMEIQSLEILSFRDKRVPFRENKNKPLPMAAFKKFKFAVELDTLRIKDSKITYEEFPEEGFESGKVVFENLNATMSNVNNRSYYNKPDHATLEASARIMGKGSIQASFYLPLDDAKPYHAKGKIKNMSLQYLNPALENLAFISVESGRLNELAFDFDYNDKVSNGSLMINYQDLKFKGLKKEKSGEKDDLKTLLINTIVRNDKDKNVPAEKRTGAISFERDHKRQIFNYWWKSLLSGIKESVLSNGKGRKNKTSQKP